MSDTQAFKVLVTGAGGQLGAALCASAPAAVELYALSRAELDIANAGDVQAMLDDQAPALLINAAAYTAVDQAEQEPALAFAANAEAPGLLARACAARGIRFFHVSTDFVFDGLRSSPYAPDADTAPLGVYGRSKRSGEQAVLDAAADCLIVRTGWVYSHEGRNFLRTMLRLHAERDLISVVADQVGTPTDAYSLAEALWAAAHRPSLKGIYHFSDAGVCSWFDFALAIGEEAHGLGLLDKVAQVIPIRSEDYPTPARRPAYSVLDKTLTWRDFEITPTQWRQRLRAVLARINETDHG